MLIMSWITHGRNLVHSNAKWGFSIKNIPFLYIASRGHDQYIIKIYAIINHCSFTCILINCFWCNTFSDRFCEIRYTRIGVRNGRCCAIFLGFIENILTQVHLEKSCLICPIYTFHFFIHIWNCDFFGIRVCFAFVFFHRCKKIPQCGSEGVYFTSPLVNFIISSIKNIFYPRETCGVFGFRNGFRL